ncbi:hypothetical protein EWM64_g3973 [Hericium alpestre]|uniref:DUF6535 domain-containing protein n=1 Tax=Hericium alpestre TaxID=135208 RepID=A0A4Z0A2E8_9AGAM|nr:hypothetical protein EWM64_g3973 [Hericium alpestre]
MKDDAAKEPHVDYGESSAKIWSVYVNATEKYDRALVESWKGDMDGILIFAGLFSAVVTAFLVESSKLFQEDQSTTTTAILAQISLQLSAMSNHSQAPVPPFNANIHPPVPSYALRVNVLWVLSLLLSLLCALCATLIQGWARNYLHAVERHAAPHQRARIRAFLFYGIEQSRVDAIVEGVPLLLHVSLFLFIAGIQQYIAPFNGPVALMVLIVLFIYLAIYAVTSIAPLVILSSAGVAIYICCCEEAEDAYEP